jgi:hypothetical protein
MDINTWIDKHIDEIKTSMLFKRYFETAEREEGSDVMYLINAGMGIDLVMRPTYIVKAIHLHSGSQEGMGTFPDPLPLNLSFHSTKKEVRQCLGAPYNSGGGDSSLIYDVTPFWDKFFLNNYYIHFQYNEHTRIELVTLESILG